jgi:hypothetical protein
VSGDRTHEYDAPRVDAASLPRIAALLDRTRDTAPARTADAMPKPGKCLPDDEER